MSLLQTEYRRIRKRCRALDAYRAAQYVMQREIKWRLLGLPEVPDSPVTGWGCVVAGYTVEVDFAVEQGCDCFNDDYVINYKMTEPNQHLDQYRLDSVTAVTLKGWTESDSYRNWRGQKYGKAEARRLAIQCRQDIVKQAYDINRGNVGYYWASAKCVELDWQETLGCLQDTDFDAFETFFRDALESVLRLSQSVKEAA